MKVAKRKHSEVNLIYNKKTQNCRPFIMSKISTLLGNSDGAMMDFGRITVKLA